jgi:hypothetical protein
VRSKSFSPKNTSSHQLYATSSPISIQFKIARSCGHSARKTGQLKVALLDWPFWPWGWYLEHRISPLYAIKICFDPIHGIEINELSIYGVMSLIFWTLTLVVSTKYLLYVMRADNQGEGGILALLALTLKNTKQVSQSRNSYSDWSHWRELF